MIFTVQFFFERPPAWLPRFGRSGGAPTIIYRQKLVDSVINQRKETGPKSPPDILDELLDAQRHDLYFTDPHIRDNLNVLLIAGHDTTARMLS